MAYEPLVSVVVPSYQQTDYIDRTVQSVLDQDGVDFELVVSDHTSTDGTWERLQAYADDPRVRILRTPAGGGAPRNWNAVTEQARGVYLKLLPGDDTLLPGTLARQARILDSDERIVLTAGRRDIVDARGKTVLRRRGLGPLTHRMSGADAIRATVRSGTNLFGEPGAVMFRAETLRNVGGWDAASPYAIDEGTFIRVLEHGDFAPDPETASTFRLSGTQWSVALVRQQAEQMATLHRAVHQRRPDILDARDVRVGDRRARLLAYQRKFVYSILKERMS